MSGQATISEATDAGMQRCIAECLDCHQICLQAVTFCLRTGGEHAREDHIRLLTDCAQICVVTADFMARRSPHHAHLCRECAEICAQCADDCDRLGQHEEMRRCAEACRRCAQSCRGMVRTA